MAKAVRSAPPAHVQPAPRRITARSTLVYIAASVLPAALSIPLVPTLWAQIRSMHPNLLALEEHQRRGRFVDAARAAERRGLIVHQALNLLHHQPGAVLPVRRVEELDTGNGLYAALGILQRWRREAPVTQPAEARALIAALERLAAGPPARLHHRAMQEKIYSALHERGGLDPREAAVESIRAVSIALRTQHRPVIREWVDHALQQAERLRSAGEPRAALVVELSAARLLLQLLEDSPTFDVALLASEQLPSVLRAAGDDAERLGTADADAARTAADAAAQLATDWHAACTGEVDMIPFSGSIPADVAASAQPGLIRVFSGALVAIAAWCILALAVILLSLAVGLLRPTVSLMPAFRGSLALGAAIILTPLTVLMTWLTLGHVSFTWLFTLNSGGRLIWLGPVAMLAISLAGRVATRLPAEYESARRPRSAAALMALALLTLFAVGCLWPTVSVYGIPADVRRYRRLMVLLGLGSTILLAGWFAWGRWRLRKVLPAGALMKAQLAVAGRALPVLAVIMLVLLAVNARRDRAHQQAYATAARDIVADKLGADWRTHYFDPAAAMTDRLWKAAAAQQGVPNIPGGSL